MNTETYNPNYRQKLNQARLSAQSLQQQVGRAQKNILKIRQSSQKASEMWQKGQKGSAISEMAAAAQGIDDQYGLSKRNLNIARMHSTAQDTARSLEKIERAVLQQKKLSAILETLKLAHSFRKKIADYDNTPFPIILIAAIVSDFVDIIPFVGTLLKIFQFYALWGKGAWKVKVFCRILLFFDMIPPLSWLPMSTISVAYVWRKCAQEAAENKKSLDKAEEQIKKEESELSGIVVPA